MTGREMIIYILENGLEDNDVINILFHSNAFMSITEAAKKFEVGTATVNAWVTGGYLKAFVVDGELRIPADAKPRGLKTNV